MHRKVCAVRQPKVDGTLIGNGLELMRKMCKTAGYTLHTWGNLLSWQVIVLRYPKERYVSILNTSVGKVSK